MLFRTYRGELVEIKKYDFTNDKLYYKKIMEIKRKLSKTEKIHDSNNNTLKCKNS